MGGASAKRIKSRNIAMAVEAASIEARRRRPRAEFGHAVAGVLQVQASGGSAAARGGGGTSAIRRIREFDAGHVADSGWRSALSCSQVSDVCLMRDLFSVVLPM